MSRRVRKNASAETSPPASSSRQENVPVIPISVLLELARWVSLKKGEILGAGPREDLPDRADAIQSDFKNATS